MTGRLRAEGGFTIVELLVTSTLALIVLGATLITFTGMESGSARNRDATDLQARARNAIDRMARDMRNLATPTPALPIAIEKASPTDVVLLAVGDTRPAGSQNTRNLKRVRYCLNTSTKVLWTQSQTWTTAASPTGATPPSTATCPATGGAWTASLTAPVVQGVTGTQAFSFDQTLTANPTVSGSAAADAVLSSIRTITTTLTVDDDITRPPAASTLSSAVVLRNQNRAPEAMFDVKVIGNGHAYLFATGSTDAEGQGLDYEWYDGDPAAGGTLIPNCPSSVCDYKPTPGTHLFYLRVIDPAGLSDDAGPKSVTL